MAGIKETKSGNVRVLEYAPEDEAGLSPADLERLGKIDAKERARLESAPRRQLENTLDQALLKQKIDVPEKVAVPLDKRRAPGSKLGLYPGGEDPDFENATIGVPPAMGRPGGPEEPGWSKALDTGVALGTAALHGVGGRLETGLNLARDAGVALGLKNQPMEQMGPATGALNAGIARELAQPPITQEEQTARAQRRPSGPSQSQISQKELDNSYGAMAKAAEAEAQALRQRSALELQAQEEHLTNQRKLAAQQDEFNAKRAQAMDAQQKELQKAITDANAVNTEVNPSRFWGSRDTGQKIMGFVGLLFGALGAPATGGENKAVTLMNKIIDDDISLQKDQIALNISKANRNVDNQRNLLGVMRDKFQDDIQALSATRLAMMDQFETQMNVMLSKSRDPEISAKLQTALATLEQEKAKEHMRFAQQAEVNSQKWAEINLERQKLALAGAAGGGKALPAEQGDKLARLEAGRQLMQDQFDKMLSAAPRASSTGFSTAEKVGKYVASNIPEPFSNEYKTAKQEAELKAETAIKAIQGEALMENDIKRAHQHAFMPWDDRDVLIAKNNYWQEIIRKRLQTSKAVLGTSYDVRGVSAPTGAAKKAFRPD